MRDKYNYDKEGICMKKLISILLGLCLLLMSFGVSADSALLKLREVGIVEGFEDGELHPEIILSRAQFAKIMVNTFPDVVTTEIFYEFDDLDSSHWAANYIQKAVNAGWIEGFPDNTVRPDDSITFEQAVTVVCRALDLTHSYYSYPEDYISTAIEYSITDGVNSVIDEEINRGEAAKIIINALDFLESERIENEAEELMETNYESYASGYSVSSGNHTNSSKGLGLMVDEVTDGLPAPGLPDYYEDEYFFFPQNTEEYSINNENVFKNVISSPLSTFSIDVDTASYSNMRRFILNGQSIPDGSIRVEELINYFNYDQADIQEGTPFGVKYSVSKCPWNPENLLAMITVSGEELKTPKPSNIVFLIDISGSMYSYNKLPLVKRSLSMMLDKLYDSDTVSIVTYASGTKVVLEPTPVSEKDKIISAINRLYPYGGTYGEGGIVLAYEQAEKNKIDGNNRIILCTDGDFNIGLSSEAELDKLITEKREKGIFLSVLGFGMDNYKDNKMETLADKGNGNYAYIDNLREAKKVLVDEMPKTIYTIAKDVKIQAEFNPAKVSQYRLVGYENRLLNDEDFEDDKKDAGELGAGATVTVLYEIIPQKDEIEQTLKYQTVQATGSDELMNIKIRYKMPDGNESILTEYPISSDIVEPTAYFKFASAVAELGMILNDSEYKGNADYESVMNLARESVGEDIFGIRSEFIQLVDLLKYREIYK